jgi:hypothetical protein
VRELKSPASDDQLLIQLVQELSLHEKAEQGALWTMVRDLTQASTDIDLLLSQEHALEHLLEDLVVELGRENTHQWLLRVRELVVQHVQTEEKLAFPILQQHLDHALRERLGNDYQAAKAASTAQMAKLNVIMAPELQVEPARPE